jgi:hypothetical protein
MMTDKQFYEKYTPEHNVVLLEEFKQEENSHITIDDICPFSGCMYETYGEELEYVRTISNKNIKRVWTILDGEDGELTITAGFHFINRLGYLITKEEWNDDNEEYICQ